MNWVVYIVECADGSLYTGIARNLDQRIEAHNQGLGARYTRSRRPVRLRFVEPAANRAAAQAREYRIKRLDRAAKQTLIEAAGQAVQTA